MKQVVYLGKPDVEQRRKDSIANPKQLYPTHQCFQDSADYVLATCFTVEHDDGSTSPVREPLPWIFNSKDPEKMEAVQKRLDGPFGSDAMQVVHGLITCAGHPMMHAWVEVNDVVIETFWFAGQKVVHPMLKQDWDEKMKPVDVTRYTADEMAKLWQEHDSAGPWEPRYVAMCDDLASKATATLPGLPRSVAS